MNWIRTFKSYHRRWQRFNADFLEKNPADGVPWRMMSSVVMFLTYKRQLLEKNPRLSRIELVSKIVENPGSFLLTLWSLGEVTWFCLKKIHRFGKYLQHYFTPDPSDRTTILDRESQSLDEPFSLWNHLNKQSQNDREIILFVQRNQLILIQDKETEYASDTWEDIRPSKWKYHYDRVVADSRVGLNTGDDPLRAYISSEFSMNVADVDNVADVIYSYLYSSTWAISEGHERGLELVTVRHREDQVQPDRLFSAVILGVVLESISVPEPSSVWKTRLDYDRLLDTVHKAGWRSNLLCEYLREDLHEMADLYPGDLAQAMNLRLKNLGDWYNELEGIIGIAREFYLDYWSILSLDSPYKAEVASVLGRLDVLHWYLKTIDKYPIGIEPHSRKLLTDENLHVLQTGHRNVMGSDIPDLNWVRGETVKIFYLSPDLNLSKATIYYWKHIIPGAAGGHNRYRVYLESKYGEDTFYRHPISNNVGVPSEKLLLLCESKPDANIDMVENWLSQYCNYLMVKYLCGESPAAGMRECLLTLQGDICLQRMMITRKWDYWFYRQVIEHFLEASRGRSEPKSEDSDPELDYITDSLGILARKRTSITLFAEAMDVSDCLEMLKGFKQPSYVHVLMAFQWADVFIDLSKVTGVRYEDRILSTTRDNIKSIFDRVKHYHFPNDYKKVLNPDLPDWIIQGATDSVFNNIPLTRDVFRAQDENLHTNLYLNRTKYVYGNSYGGLLKNDEGEERVWERLLEELDENGRGVLGSSEARDCLVKSLAYSCLRHNLTAHVCFVTGKRMERGETLIYYGQNSDDEFANIIMNTNFQAQWPEPYFADDQDLPFACREDSQPWELIDSLASFHRLHTEPREVDVTVNHLNTGTSENWYYENVNDDCYPLD